MAPHPGFDTEEIREKARKDLLDLLESVRGKKNLVIEQALAGPTGNFVKFSTLQQYGVDQVFYLESDNVNSSQKNVIFLVRGENPDQALAVAEQIKRLQQKSQIVHEFTILLTPRRTLVSDKVFEGAGILGDLVIEEFPLYFLPLEQDLLSLELDQSFGDLFLRKDPTCIFLAAKALMLIQQKHGLFPRIIGKGDHAHRLMDLLFRMRSEVVANESSPSTLAMLPSTSIESLIVVDREVDFGTVLLTQLTYEGLIDERYHVKDGCIDVDTSIVGTAPGQQNKAAQQGMKRKVMLDSTDRLYEQMRDSNFAVVTSLLSDVAKRLKTDYDSRHTAMSTAELREFVTKLPGYQAEQQSLRIHSGLVEDIMKYTNSDFFTRLLEIQQNLAQSSDPATQHDAIEELISRNAPLSDVLRLLCLESWVSGGIRAKDLEGLKTQILHAYGYQHIMTLDALEKMQLLVPRASGNVFALNTGSASGSAAAARTNYNYLRKALRLIVDEVKESSPNDIAYVYSGYAPLSVRLVQCVLQKQRLHALTKNQPAGTADHTEDHTSKNAGGTGSGSAAGGGGSGSSGIGTAAHGWQGFEDALKAAKGSTFNRVQKGDEAATKARSVLSGTSGKKTVVVMFIGGITRTEIAALRFLGRGDPSRKILICTTSVITGQRMIDVAIEHRHFGPERNVPNTEAQPLREEQ